MDVPIIDLAARNAAGAIDEACREVGFFAIIGHGVSDQTLERAWRLATEFFDLPSTNKLSVKTDGAAYPYGYFPMDQESLGDDAPPDLNESFNLGPAHLPRRWPEHPSEFRAAWLDYYEAMSDLASRLMSVFATGLGLPAAYFDPLIDRHSGALRALNYPAQPTPPVPGQIRAAPHTDYGTVTILKPGQATGGLEVLTATGAWGTVPVLDDGFVINIGDMMQMWTNDAWRSTVHRVVNPDTAVAASETPTIYGLLSSAE